jgi:hypothetical protein
MKRIKPRLISGFLKMSNNRLTRILKQNMIGQKQVFRMQEYDR